MNALALLALIALAPMQQATDTTVALDGATRLRVENPGGSVVITTWDRPAVRVEAQHSTRTYVEVRRSGATLAVDAESRRGPATIVDYRITVPRALDLAIEGMYADVTVEGADGAVDVETLQGEIRIRGGRGTVSATSVSGRIDIEGAQGRVEAEAVGQGIRVANSSGEIYVESVGGPITLENVQARVVEAGNVGGGIRFSGPLAPGGTYFFGSHGGTIALEVPASTSASFSLATLHGRISSDLPGAPTTFERGERHSFTVGGGGATVEAETYGGRISVNVRPGG